MSDAGSNERFIRKGERRWWTVARSAAAYLSLFFCIACSRDPQSDFQRAQAHFLQGDLVRAQGEAEKAFLHYSGGSPLWAWKFRLLDAKVLAWRGQYTEILKVLGPELPPSLNEPALRLEKQILVSIADIRLHRYQEAQDTIALAGQACVGSNSSICGELSNVRGSLEVERGEYEQAKPFFAESLSLARGQNDRFLEAWALLNLTHVALLEEHFDEAIDRSDSTYRVATAIGAQRIMLTSLGNLGWASYKTGDSERALDLFLDAERRARALGSLVDEVRWLTTSGYIYLDQGKYGVAEDCYGKALGLARQIDSKEQISDAITSLAFVTVRTGELDSAIKYSEEAIALARADNNRVDELYPLLAKGQIAARRGDDQQAKEILSEVTNDSKVDTSLKWEAQRELANLYADDREPTKAIDAYRKALVTFEQARSSIQHEDLKLPFLGNASTLYDDYVGFLLTQGKTQEALSIADHARARTLSEGLGQLGKDEAALPTALNAQRIARTAGGAVLYYWLGQKQSYLWAITPQKTSLFKLPAASEMDAVVKRYRKALERPREGIESQNQDGLDLYRMLVQPAREAIGKSPKVFVIPDGSLNGLNFEALLVPDPKPHYWIEDVTIANASSLRLLGSFRHAARTRRGKLLLVGDPVAPTPEYATPPQAATEIADVGEHFAATDRQVFAENKATPAAYLGSKPEQFSYIHFVAHGTASRLSPLDSAIVLSRSSPEDDSFRLYARDIIQRPLHADLVTISACYGAGSRAYSGEGLVGLSWAFLRAGAHNVIGALWDVSDASTPLLMDRMYTEIRNGKRPEEALRLAKLSLLHSDNAFRRPFYWAPFQFYTGS
jgi:CHAT domain-containing protein